MRESNYSSTKRQVQSKNQIIMRQRSILSVVFTMYPYNIINVIIIVFDSIQIVFKPKLDNFPFDIQDIDLKYELSSIPLKKKHSLSGLPIVICFNVHRRRDVDSMLRFKNIIITLLLHFFHSIFSL